MTQVGVLPSLVAPDTFAHFSSVVDIKWRLRVLAHSFFNYSRNKKAWCLKGVEKCFKTLATSNVHIDTLYSLIKLLLGVNELRVFFAPFSIERFLIERHEIPTEWLMWTITEVDRLEHMKEGKTLTLKLAELMPRVFSRSKLADVDPQALHRSTIHTYLTKCVDDYIIVWFIRALINSWSLRYLYDLSTESFEATLNEANYSIVDPRILLDVHQPLLNDKELYAVYHRIVSTRITPLLLTAYENVLKTINERQNAPQIIVSNEVSYPYTLKQRMRR
ncbi:hypothetical protein RCL1_006755 [Eukaryota sp. TZLM3-RCL]